MDHKIKNYLCILVCMTIIISKKLINITIIVTVITKK